MSMIDSTLFLAQSANANKGSFREVTQVHPVTPVRLITALAFSLPCALAAEYKVGNTVVHCAAS